MFDKRQFLAGLGIMATSSALAQIHTPTTPAKKQIPQRRAKTTKLFKAPPGMPNGIAVTPEGLWIGEQKLSGAQAATYHMAEPRSLSEESPSAPAMGSYFSSILATRKPS